MPPVAYTNPRDRFLFLGLQTGPIGTFLVGHTAASLTGLMPLILPYSRSRAAPPLFLPTRSTDTVTLSLMPQWAPSR